MLINKRIQLPLFFLFLAAVWLGADLFPTEGWALGGADMRGLFYPWWEHVRNSLFQSQVPFWDTRHFAGSPFLHNPQVAFFYPPSWLVFLLPINIGISFYYLFHLSVAGWGMARLVEQLRSAEQQPKLFGASLGALAAGIAFMLGGFFATRIFAGHVGFLATHIWLPWLMVSTARGLVNKNWRYMAPTALFFALSILAGHTTTVLYLGLIWGLFAVWQGWQDRIGNPLFSLVFLLISGLLSLGIAGVQLLPTLQLIQRSGRLSQGGYDFATRFSLPWQQIVTLIIPEWFGEPTHIGYWGGENFEELTAYPAIFASLTLIVTLFTVWRYRENKWLLFFAGLSLLGILIAVGSNGFLYRWLYVIFPPFRVMRAPGRALFFVSFSAPVLLGLQIDELFKRPFWGERRLNQILPATALLWIGLLLGLLISWWLNQAPDIAGRRWHQLENSALVGGILLCGLLLLKWLLANTHRHQAVLIGSMGLLLLLIGDLAFFGRKLIRAEAMTPAPLWFEAAEVLGEPQGRVLPWGINIFEQNGAGQLGIESIFGYNTLENGSITTLAASVPDPRSKAYDVLAVSHVVSESGLEQYTEGKRGLTLLSQINTTRVYSRTTALPYARLVSRYEVLGDRGAQYERLHQDDFDPAGVVLLETEPSCTGLSQSNDFGNVVIVERQGGTILADVESHDPGLLVIAEAFFPGWQVTIDGEKAEIERAYSALQAVCIPAGEHRVEFVFRPTIFIWGGIVSLVTLLIVVTLWFKKRPETGSMISGL